MFVIRNDFSPGENVALFGEVDLENENKGNLTQVSIEEILERHQRETSLKGAISICSKLTRSRQTQLKTC